MELPFDETWLYAPLTIAFFVIVGYTLITRKPSIFRTFLVIPIAATFLFRFLLSSINRIANAPDVMDWMMFLLVVAMFAGLFTFINGYLIYFVDAKTMQLQLRNFFVGDNCEISQKGGQISIKCAETNTNVKIRIGKAVIWIKAGAGSDKKVVRHFLDYLKSRNITTDRSQPTYMLMLVFTMLLITAFIYYS